MFEQYLENNNTDKLTSLKITNITEEDSTAGLDGS